MKNRLQKYFIIFFFVALELYRPTFISNSPLISRYAFNLLGLLLLVYALFYRKGKINLNIYSKIGFVLIIASMFTSIMMATIYNGQSFGDGLSSTLPYLLSYLSFFIVVRFNIKPVILIQIIKLFAILTMAIMVVNLVTYPNVLFGTAELSEVRGGLVRVRVPGIMTVVFLLLYSIHNYVVVNNKKSAKWILICSVFVILSLTRQLILYSFILGVFMYLVYSKLYKGVTFFIFIIIVGFTVVPKIELFENLINYTKQQLSSGNDDIRLLAWDYYTSQKQPNPNCYIWGTGAPNSNSNYGKRFFAETEDLKFFIVDIGYGGFFYLFGAIGIIGIAFVFLSAFFYIKNSQYSYVIIFIIANILMGFTSGVILYKYEVVLIMISLYLLAYKNDNSYSNSKLQQSNRYNQLY